MFFFFLSHKDTKIIREELHCFYTVTKIWVCFEKAKRVACVTDEAGAND